MKQNLINYETQNTEVFSGFSTRALHLRWLLLCLPNNLYSVTKSDLVRTTIGDAFDKTSLALSQIAIASKAAAGNFELWKTIYQKPMKRNNDE